MKIAKKKQKQEEKIERECMVKKGWNADNIQLFLFLSDDAEMTIKAKVQNLHSNVGMSHEDFETK